MKVNLQFILILLGIIIIGYLMYYRRSSEQFTPEENLFAEKLSEFLKTKPNFIKYLDKLVELNNTKGVYNKYIENEKLKASDILKEL
jgi:hypothetical protein